MGLIERSAMVAARPETIWKLYAPAMWPKWDMDVTGVENVSGSGLLSQGHTADMTMKDGTKFTATFPQVRENEFFEMKATLFGGLVVCQMSHTLEVKPEGTHILYKFGFTGALGGLIQWANNKDCVRGTEEGLENVKRLAEEAEKAGG